MATAFSGGWRSRATARPKPSYGRTTPAVGGNPNLAAGARLEHLQPADYSSPFGEPTPDLPPLPAYMYAQDDYLIPALPPVSVPLDREPQGHEHGSADRGRTPLQSQRYAAAAHERDFGAADAIHHEPPRARADADVYHTQRVEVERAVAGSRMALVRGRNSLPENNPDGPPDQGFYVMRWIDRQYKRRGIRTDVQPLRPYRAAVAADAPAPAPAQANQYTSPFARLGNARRLKLATPQVRRVPRPPDDASETDGTDDPQYAAPAYWQGW